MEHTPEKKAFKDWFDPVAARGLGEQVQRMWPEFPLEHFVAHATRGLAGLELYGRVQQFAEALAACLPSEPAVAMDILCRSLPPCLPKDEAVTDGWLQWPLGHFIATYGLNDFEAAFHFMTELTQRFSAEFAVRPYVEAYPERTFAELQQLTAHPSPHVRRWCSEGPRPRLPWGRRLDALVADPAPLWPILEVLKDDPSLYVRKSVANCLNDISKDHPELLLDRMETWAKSASPERQWIIRHALRTLIKAGHPRALALMGYTADPPVKAIVTLRPGAISPGDRVELEAQLQNHSPSPQELLIDFVVTFPGKTGTPREKVFKWTTLTLSPKEIRTLRKTLTLFKPTSIRALYPGEHRLQLQLNGTRQGHASLTLLQN
jgi:3-methyladenine DNA glycosylase AlkC